MNLAKAQSEIISEVYKRRVKDDKPVLFDEMAGTPYVGVLTSGYFAYVFPRDDFLLNTAEMQPTRILSNLYGSEECTRPLKWNGKTRTMDKLTTLELVNEKGEITLVDIKFVKKFGKPSDVLFKQERKKSAVFVYAKCNEVLLGIIMPRIPNKT